MNEIIKAMETRRSIRGYKEDMVPEELIAEVVEAGNLCRLSEELRNGKDDCRADLWCRIGGGSGVYYQPPTLL